MITVPRIRALVIAGLAGFLLTLPIPSPATAQQAQQPQPACAATGYLAGSEDELAALRSTLGSQPVQRAAGVPLADGQTWVIPDGSRPVVVVDSTAPLSGGAVSVTLAGQEFEVSRTSFDVASNRYVSNVSLPHLGPTVRSLGLTVDSAPCELAVVLSVDRSLWSTVAGGAAVGMTVLFGLLTVWVARRRKGGWPRRFAFAAPLGLVAGIGQAAVLLEAGVVSPFATPPWWAPAGGLGLAAVLPLTRWRRRRPALPPPPPPPAPWFPPTHAPLGGYRIDAPFTTTEVATVYRATNDSGERALVKLLLPERYGEPSSRLRLEREARALSGWEHPNVLRLRETVTAQPGPPTLVFEDVDGAPLRRLLAGGGALSGPQAVTIALGVLSGLRTVHDRELVHRDIRPENVWLDARGRVLLAGFELAATGVEHQLAPEGAAPYASPEQRAGRVLDGRSDLWACGLLLAELLTGQPAIPPPATGLPEPLAAVLARALAEDPAGRPASALRFSAELWDAAEQAYGADWLGRGALAGAIAAHTAVGAAVAGYALGAGVTAGGGAVAGAGAAIGTATLGSAPAAAPTITTLAAPASAAGSTAAGSTTSAVVNAAVVAVAGVAIAATAVLVNPAPAEARALVITPDQARVIFVQTMAETRDETFTHLSESAQGQLQGLLAEDESLAGSEPVDIGVGVPREQYEYPAWFVAWATIPFDGGTASVFVRFERASAGEPWLVSSLQWATDRLLPAAVVDEDGWLVPPPAVTALLVDPASLPERYHAWLERANESGEAGSDEVLSLRFPESGMIVWFTEEDPFYNGEDPETVSSGYELAAGEVVTDPVPLVDGTVHVSFTSTITLTTYNTPDLRTASCDSFSLVWEGGDPAGDFRSLVGDLIVSIDAWVPVTGAAGAGDRVVIEDWSYHEENRGGEPC
jgi:tRNA A-37 threonylcarbamoyl transferase component Bud32